MTDTVRTQAICAEIFNERVRQVVVEGWTPEHDDHRHTAGDLLRAAACYTLFSVAAVSDETEPGLLTRLWPWAWTWWKPKGDRRNLIRAAALIVAEIERLDREAARNG